MIKHKYSLLVKFVKLRGIKELKDTCPLLFNEDGTSTSTFAIDNNKKAIVTMEDAKNACQKFLDNKITINQLQQWGEWIHLGDLFELMPNGKEPDFDESLIDIITEIDNLDIVNEEETVKFVKNIISKTNNWILSKQLTNKRG